MRDLFILDGHTPVPCEDVEQWARWFECSENRIVARTETPCGTVSTVFLGVNHAFHLDGPPILFETMIFGGPHDQERQWRYCTWDEALAGHNRVVQELTDAAPLSFAE